ncbi:replication initiator protein [Sigmofec virus UA08Rod_5667]|uniref:Replication initiator protein n=1 Tax=Sigmofec virus UA08Rod_5667 TaxID=2929435 RepID=A0A976N1B2_9VIRU|nr:replication initiator protein [Sigmofec virus UA08Rod_5667]
MSCFHPITAFDVTPKYFTVNERRKIVFQVSSPLHEQLAREGRVLQLPCGQCIGCRLEYSRQWANRCLLEKSYHDSSFFVTLTYDDAHVPKTFSVDEETGEVLSPAMTLRSRHLQLFLKLVRRHFPDDNIRFFGCGEYGTYSLRPHYHLILFGLHLNDLVTYSKSPLGFQYFNSESLSRCWIDGQTGESRGYVVVGDVSWDSCAYVARYLLKKQKGATAEIYKKLNIEPEFSRMSRKPGIGRQFYDDHPEIWRFNQINLKGDSGGRSFPHPLYLRRLFEIDDPFGAFELSEKRKLNAISKNILKSTLTDNDYYDILKIEEESKQRRLKSLFREVL